jgi:hypothetical protein
MLYPAELWSRTPFLLSWLASLLTMTPYIRLVAFLDVPFLALSVPIVGTIGSPTVDFPFPHTGFAPVSSTRLASPVPTPGLALPLPVPLSVFAHPLPEFFFSFAFSTRPPLVLAAFYLVEACVSSFLFPPFGSRSFLLSDLEMTRLELVTPCMQGKCTTNCATFPFPPSAPRLFAFSSP